MAKFSMKDYENFMEEEKRQDQLQWEVECRREFETSGSERDWYDYLAKQEEERRLENSKEDGYFDEDDFREDYYDEDDYDPDDMETAYDPYGDLLDTGVPDESDDCYRPTAEDLYDMYAQSCEESSGYELDTEDDLDDLILSENIQLEVNPEELRISRKAVARNRHHAAEKAKRRAQQSATILSSRYRNANIKTDYEEFRLYSRSIAAEKKAARIKTA